jgi:hypothetical protein
MMISRTSTRGAAHHYMPRKSRRELRRGLCALCRLFGGSSLRSLHSHRARRLARLLRAPTMRRATAAVEFFGTPAAVALLRRRCQEHIGLWEAEHGV